MSQTSPLYNLTPDVKTQITVTAQANRIRVVNDSSLYLRVYFGADAPLLATDPGWHDTISPGDKPLLWITGGTGQTWWAQSGNPSSTPFTGVITFLPFIPVGALQSSGGVITGAAILYITAFSPDENADRGGQTEAFVQGAKQGRYQSVAGAILNTSGLSANSDQTTANNTILINGILGGLTPSGVPALFAANAAGVSVINVYVYWYAATLRSKTPAIAFADYMLRIVLTDNVSTVKLGSQFLPVTLHAAGMGVDRFIFAPSHPVVVRLTLAQGQLVSGDLLSVQFRNDINPLSNPSLGVYDIKHTIALSFDAINQTPLLDIAQPNAAFSVFPWNATYNPQTY